MIQLSTKNQIIIVIVVAATAFAFGRYSVRSTSVEVKTDTTKQAQTDTIDHTVTHKTETITKDPDGKTVDVVVTDTRNDQDQTTRETDDTKTDSQTITNSKGSKVNISLLVGQSLTQVSAPQYGLSVSKELIGPITMGLWGTSNGVLGLSVGLDF